MPSKSILSQRHIHWNSLNPLLPVRFLIKGTDAGPVIQCSPELAIKGTPCLQSCICLWQVCSLCLCWSVDVVCRRTARRQRKRLVSMSLAGPTKMRLAKLRALSRWLLSKTCLPSTYSVPLHSFTWRVCILCIQAVTYSFGADPSNTTTVVQKADAQLITVSTSCLHLHEVCCSLRPLRALMFYKPECIWCTLAFCQSPFVMRSLSKFMQSRLLQHTCAHS